MLEVRDLSISFGEKVIFKHFHLSVARGEKVLLRAPSGSGKTTLLRAITGLIPIDAGQIYVSGLPVNAKNIFRIRSKIAYAGQDAAFADLPARQLLDEVFSYSGNAGTQLDRGLLAEYLRRLCFEESLLDKKYSKLSAGEKQRFGLILALLMQKPLMLLDEITANLDAELKRACAQLIASLDCACLVISHDNVFSFREVRL